MKAVTSFDADSDQATAVDPLTDATADWLMACALREMDVSAIFEGCCERLLSAGVPIGRAMVSFRTLHPLFASVSLVWKRGEHVGRNEFLHGQAFTSEQWRVSPQFHLLERGVDLLRRPLAGPEALLDFPVLTEFATEGFTDYLAYAVEFDGSTGASTHIPSSSNGLVGSWLTNRPGGFGGRQLAALIRVQRRLAVALRAQIQLQVTRNVLHTYLGRNAGEQVLRGDIRRGDGNAVDAVIWMSDLRGSTPLADSLEAEDFLELLNSYFECTAGAVLAAGGEVLRFIGDAVLAIFSVAECSRGAAASKALAAARDAEARLAAANEARVAEGLASFDFGVGLHVGRVMFGNIGVPERLEFTVVGPAANEVARLEALTKTLGRRVLVSGDFADLVDEPFDSLGSHCLRGVGEEVTVCAPRPGATPP